MPLEKLTLDKREQYGVKDYYDLFAQITPTNGTTPFSGIIGQRKTIEDTLTATDLDRRCIANIGTTGVGKSIITTELLNTIVSIEERTEIESEYTQQICDFVKKLKQLPRGDILSFWNPTNATKPLVYRLKRNVSAENIQASVSGECTQWRKKLLDKINEEVSVYFEKKTTLIEENKFPQVAHLSREHREKLTELFHDAVSTFVEECKYELTGASYLTRWKQTVQETLANNGAIHSLVSGVIDREEERSEYQEIRDSHLTLNVQGGRVILQALMKPGVVFRDSDQNKLNIRRLSKFKFEQLFPRVGAQSLYNPYHHLIKPGILATEQLLVIDDNVTKLFRDKEIHGQLLSYMQEGTLHSEDETSVQIYNPAWLIVNDSKNPFFIQHDDGQPAEFDEPMARRCTIIKYPNVAIRDENIAREMGQLMVNTAEKKKMKIEPEAMNLIYHKLISTAPEALLPLDVGSFKPEFIEKPLSYAKGLKKSTLTADDLIDYYWSQREKTHEHTMTQREIKQFHHQTFEPRIGAVWGIAVYSSIPTCPGAPFLHTVNETNSFGHLSSPEWKAGLLDKTFKKGLLCDENFIEEHFGPVGIKMEVRYPSYEEFVGPSSSAAVLFAFMSRIGDIPFRQNVCYTGTLQDDGNGAIGAIGAVHEKNRGSSNFFESLKRHGIKNVPSLDVCIPSSNAEEFLRELQFDKELQVEMKGENPRLSVYTYPTAWEGFEFGTRLTRKEYTKKIRQLAARKRRRIIARSVREKVLGSLQAFLPYKV